jgi:hypothetical protein
LERPPRPVPGIADPKALPRCARSRLSAAGFEFDLRRVEFAKRRLAEGRLEVCSERVADALLAQAAEALGQAEETRDWLMLSQ